MIGTYSWSFDPTPSNKDGIPMAWTISSARGQLKCQLLRSRRHFCKWAPRHTTLRLLQGRYTVLIRQDTE